MTKSFLAGGVYFLIVFVAAFALGVLRVTFIVPMVGELWATVAELPFTLAISWFVCARICRFLRVQSLFGAVAMGGCAFALLMCAEAIGAVLLFGSSLNDHIRSYTTPAGALGLAGQVAFGLFPVVQVLRSPLSMTRSSR